MTTTTFYCKMCTTMVPRETVETRYQGKLYHRVDTKIVCGPVLRNDEGVPEPTQQNTDKAG